MINIPRARSLSLKLRVRPSVSVRSSLLSSRMRRRRRFPDTEAKLETAIRVVYSILTRSSIFWTQNKKHMSEFSSNTDCLISSEGASLFISLKTHKLSMLQQKTWFSLSSSSGHSFAVTWTTMACEEPVETPWLLSWDSRITAAAEQWQLRSVLSLLRGKTPTAAAFTYLQGSLLCVDNFSSQSVEFILMR